MRLIARMDIKSTHLIKGIQLEGLRKIGDPNEFAKKYYDDGIDEILYMDIVASLYERTKILNIVKRTTEDVFVPITVGGGIRSVEDAAEVLRAGADKVAINTAALKEPQLISAVAKKFGSQCMVLSIEAKQNCPGSWEAYYDNGREKTGMDVMEWAKRGCALGAGEILLTSVDCEGVAKGFDCHLVRAVTDAVPIPVIASGGMGRMEHLFEVVSSGHVDAVAMAHVLHYGKLTVGEVREQALAKGVAVRRIDCE
ncbi:Imidazole glycerol phosphate synthase subunit HisF [Sporomusa silvacetica DSM 10669]|uniref:Imidazole glycerol phosphate synthase subunit HisF n=1 Tax=Sporomusa silvacetica DSM 10669 TaxID=1123289 RepID=A0ABZ3IRH1_9FIRM|nr:imidazole glycerol phosphate synthase cyclase subunit [Sporomusa silvacetica]OZC20544.1 imidazole glycerol phosphate synthase subunit HisF [Sporomusa silvacetica DSM 10669]